MNLLFDESRETIVFMFFIRNYFEGQKEQEREREREVGQLNKTFAEKKFFPKKFLRQEKQTNFSFFF